MDRPNYYAILPANVRYDERLKASEKILYAEITALSNKKGYCHATNGYFAKLYEVSRETVSRWVSNLEKQGHVKTALIYEQGTKEVKERRIYVSQKSIPIDEKVNTPIDEKVKDNITSINTTSINIYNEHFEKIWKMYPNKKGKGKISDTKKKELYSLGDEIERCITRYIDYVEKTRQTEYKLSYQYGSTFFNSGYVDFLDENYEQLKQDKQSDDPYAGMEVY